MFLEVLDCCWSSNFKMRWNPNLSSLELSLTGSGGGAGGVGRSCGLGSAFGAKNPVNLEDLLVVFFASPAMAPSDFCSPNLPKKPSKLESKINGVSTFLDVPENVRSWFGLVSGAGACSGAGVFPAFIFSFHR